jgi:hypothetical protein
MKRVIAVLFAGALAFALAPASPTAAQDASQVYVVHAIDLESGVGSTPVTVCVDGAQTLTDFRTGDVAGPLELPAGTYNVQVFAGADVPCDDDVAPVIDEDVDVPGGQNLSLIAAPDAEGRYGLVALPNPVECYDAPNGRVTARHMAIAPPVNVRLGEVPVIENLANGEQQSLDVPAGPYADINVVLAADGSPVIDIGTIDVVEGQALIAYVIGGGNQEISVFTQTLDLEPCEEPVEPTTTPAPAPAPAAAPRLTG